MVVSFVKWLFIISCCSIIRLSVAFNIHVTIEENGASEELDYEMLEEELPPFTAAADFETLLGQASYRLTSGNSSTVPKKTLMKTEIQGKKHTALDLHHDNKRSVKSSPHGNRCDGQAAMKTAIMAETGTLVKLPCYRCTAGKGDLLDSLQWVEFDAVPDAQGQYHLREVELDMHDDEARNRVVVQLDHTLVIRRVRKTDTGNYMCRNLNRGERFKDLTLGWADLQRWLSEMANMHAFYHLDVIAFNEGPVVEVSEDSDKQPLEPYLVPESNVMVYNQWQRWGPCSICGDTGMTRRVSICFVTKADPIRPVSDPYLDSLLGVAPDGIPCRSEFLQMYEQHEWLRRSYEVEYSECFVACRPTRTRRGLSPSDLKSRLPDKVKTEKVKATVGRNLVLPCPGVKSFKTNVNWMNGTEYMSLVKIKKETKKRVAYNVVGSLYFEYVKFSDAGTYSCWVQKKVRGRYKLQIEQDDAVDALIYGVKLCWTLVVDAGLFLCLLLLKHIHMKVQKRRR